MSELASQIKDTTKVPLDLSICYLKELKGSVGVDSSNLAAKKDILLWKLKYKS